MASKFDHINISLAVEGSIGKRVQLETVEGILRNGKLTDVRFRDMAYGPASSGKPRSLRQPLELILDNDEGDPVPWANLVRFEVK